MKRHENINAYALGISLLREEKYQEAIDTLTALGNYEKSSIYIEEATNRLKFEEAQILYDAGRLEDALKKFQEVKNVTGFAGADESEKYIEKIQSQMTLDKSNEEPYNLASKLLENGAYEEAFQVFSALGEYKDSSDKARECENALLNQVRLKNATTISTGIRFSAGVTEENKVAFAGRGYAGEEAVLSWSDIVSVAVCGEFVLGLKSNGEVVVANGASEYRANTEGWKDIIAIAAGQQFIVGLKKDGTLTAQGYNGYGETDVDDWQNIAAISTGWQHIVGLDEGGDVFDEHGDVYFTGYNSEKIISKIQNDKERWTNLIAISTGGSSPGFPGDGHVVGLRADKSVVAAGDNSKGQCEVYGEDWKDVIAIAAGDFHTVGLRSDGIVVTTLKGGDDINAQVQEVTDSKIVAISAGYGTTIALTEDGHVVGVGFDWQGQLETDAWGKITYYK
jgi:tetratricopeptide (TPR) repeat protein